MASRSLSFQEHHLLHEHHRVGIQPVVVRPTGNRIAEHVAPQPGAFVRAGGQSFVHDDIDLPFAKLKVQFGGGAGGHNGIRSIVGSLGTNEFWRLKVGVGRPPDRVDPADYVLNRFAKVERAAVDDAVLRSLRVVEVFSLEGGDAARQAAGELND